MFIKLHSLLRFIFCAHKIFSLQTTSPQLHNHFNTSYASNGVSQRKTTESTIETLRAYLNFSLNTESFEACFFFFHITFDKSSVDLSLRFSFGACATFPGSHSPRTNELLAKTRPLNLKADVVRDI